MGGLKISYANRKTTNVALCGPKLLCGFVVYGLKSSASPQIHTFSSYKKHIMGNALNALKYVTYLYIRKRLKRQLLGLFWDRVVQYFVEFCGFSYKVADLRTDTPRNMRICDSGMSPGTSGFVKFACPPKLCMRICMARVEDPGSSAFGPWIRDEKNPESGSGITSRILFWEQSISK